MLPRKRGWAEGLAGAIREYSAGRQRKKQSDLEEALNDARTMYYTGRSGRSGGKYPNLTEAQFGVLGMSEEEAALMKIEESIALLENWKRTDSPAYKALQNARDRIAAQIPGLKEQDLGAKEPPGGKGTESGWGGRIRNWIWPEPAKDGLEGTMQTYPKPTPSEPAPQQKIRPEVLAPLLKGRDVPPEYRKLGVDRYRPPSGVDVPMRPPSQLSIPEEVDDLIKTGKAGVMGRAQPQTRKQPGLLSRQGMGEAAEGIKALIKGGHKGREGVKYLPPEPTKPEEYEAYNKVRTIWYKMPLSVQLDVWAALEAGVTWDEILGSSDGQKYMKNADTNRTNRE